MRNAFVFIGLALSAALLAAPVGADRTQACSADRAQAERAERAQADRAERAQAGRARLESQACSNLIPAGLLPPAAGFTAGCARRFTLKLGASIGTDGNYVLLAYPSCASGTCSGQSGAAGVQCQAASGYACCLASGAVVATIPGTSVASLAAGLSQRIASDSDTRSGICFLAYAGNGARIVIAPLIQLQSSNTQAALTGFATLFLTSPPAGANQATTFTVEFLDLAATAARPRSWGALKLFYR